MTGRVTNNAMALGLITAERDGCYGEAGVGKKAGRVS